MKPAHIFATENHLGTFSIRELKPEDDALLVHSWVTQAYASYWLMQDKTVAEVAEFYLDFNKRQGNQAYLGFFNESPSFIIEIYNPKHDDVAKHYTPSKGDIGMHFLAAPTDSPIKGFTRAAFDAVLGFTFHHHGAERIVVEPDARNAKIHDINKLFGFFHERQIKIGDKNAYLAFCKRSQYVASIGKNALDAAPDTHNAIVAQPSLSCESLQPEIWAHVNRLHVRKSLAELSHERIITPKKIEQLDIQARYSLQSDDPDIHYQFNATLLPLDHWLIDTDSIQKWRSGTEAPLDSLQFILEFSQTLQINQQQLPTYLEEISATLCSAAFKQKGPWLSADELAEADFQTLERSMIEGHPAFLANNGRIGFDAVDFQRYTPESAAPMRIVWLAAHRSRTHFSHSQSTEYESLLASELDLTLRNAFHESLASQGLDSEDYLLMPVHPWQWFNKLSHAYAADLASKHLICLGYGDDVYQAQQSIRTLFNINHSHKCYVKMALSILNMGFVRGLSADYMEATPAINDWVYQTVSEDATIASTGFTVLREIAAVGYRNPHYNNDILGNNPYRKMLAALWRESPVPLINDKQKLVTMAALLHVDPAGDALFPSLVRSSNVNIDDWIRAYLDCYLSPLLHCYFQHSLVFMPHGENIILVLENNVPVRCMLKDIGEEVCVLNSDIALPDNIKRISVEVPQHHEELSFFTDIFDCFFRYLSAILFEHMDYQPENFWRHVATCIHSYQQQHPEFEEKFRAHDLFAPNFGLSCLNRLQLRNNQQLIDLSDPSKMLQFSGDLDNPIAAFR